MVRWVFALAFLLAFSCGVMAYGAWQQDSLDLTAELDRLEKAIGRAEESKAADPRFLADLKAILANLRQCAGPSETQWGKYTPLITAGPASSFPGTDTDGWTVNPGRLHNPGSGGCDGGSDGYLKVICPSDGLTSYFIAPAKFHGPWLPYEELRVKIFSQNGQYYQRGWGSKGDIFLANGTKTASFDFGRRPNVNWDSFVIPLSGLGWTLGGGAKTLDEVLANITSFEIRAEHGSGGTTTGLDDVELAARER